MQRPEYFHLPSIRDGCCDRGKPLKRFGNSYHKRIGFWYNKYLAGISLCRLQGERVGLYHLIEQDDDKRTDAHKGKKRLLFSKE